MKAAMKVFVGSMVVLAETSALGAGNPNLIDTVGERPNSLVGTDVLNSFMDDLIQGLRASGQLSPMGSGGIQTYSGISSSSAQRQMEGSPSAVELTCTPSDFNGSPEANPGCQEIAPMARPLTSSICDDDPDFPLAGNTQAEGLAFCANPVVIVSNNDSLGAFGANEAACTAFFANGATANDGYAFPDRGVGKLRHTGALPISGYTINGWKDVLRLVYTGCTNTDGTCANSTDRVIRCSSAVRQELVSTWSNLFEGVACAASSGCPTGLRHAYRRSDTSGSTSFLALLDVDSDYSSGLSAGNVGYRTSVVSGLGAAASITPIPTKLAYCDGGDIEGNLPTGITSAGGASYTGGDPIRTICATEDDLCGNDGRMALVRAMKRSDDAPSGLAYPTYQCKRSFEYVPFLATAFPVCPDGTKPSGGRCKFPFYESAGFKTFNCINRKASGNPSAFPGNDGRAFNYVVHAPDGKVQFIDPATKKLPMVAQWRENMVKIDEGGLVNGKVYGPADAVCQETSDALTIGCLAAKTKCTLGAANREAAFTASQPTVHLAQDPVAVGGFLPSSANLASKAYPPSYLVYLNALRGFENIMIDCKNRGGSKTYCEDQKRLAQEIFDVGKPGNLVAGLCVSAGFAPLERAACNGAKNASFGVPCGAPFIQSSADCAIDSNDWDSLTNND